MTKIRNNKQLKSNNGTEQAAAAGNIGTITMPEQFILLVASVYPLCRDNGGWWWPKGHPTWANDVEPIPVFPPIGIENLVIKGLLQPIDNGDFDRGQIHDDGLEGLARISMVETSEFGKAAISDSQDVSTQAARRLVTLWRRVETPDEITHGW